MSKKRIVLLFFEIGFLLLITPVVFNRIFRLIGPIERYTRQTSLLVAGVIFVFAILCVLLTIKLRFIKSPYIKSFAVWAILILAITIIFSLCVPYMLGFP